MTFRKYPEIENIYHSKVIDKFVSYNPSVKDAKYIYQIKYDGANIQLNFIPNKDMRVGKRSSFIGRNDNFHGIWDVIPKYQDLINRMQEYSNRVEDEITIYGELYGKGIQKRINYGDDKYLIFFDIRINEKMLTYEEDIHRFPHIISKYYAESFGPYSYHDIFGLPVDEENEGIVIKQYNRIDPGDRILMLKKKNPKFAEKMKPKKKKESKPEDPIVTETKEKFLPYINENRVLSVFSKEGEIDDPKQIGDYIKLVMEDAIKDFEKEEDISGVDRKHLKMVYKTANREIVKILNKYL